jgi:hypothetical protein
MANCKNGLAIPENVLNGLVSLLSFKFSDEISIPILPTALSSIFLTMIIYITLLCWIFLPNLRVLFDRYVEGGKDTLEANVFKITMALFYIISISLYLVIV